MWCENVDSCLKENEERKSKKTNSFSKKQNGKKQCFQKSLKNVQTNELIFQKPRTGSISKGTKNETASGPEMECDFLRWNQQCARLRCEKWARNK